MADDKKKENTPAEQSGITMYMANPDTKENKPTGYLAKILDNLNDFDLETLEKSEVKESNIEEPVRLSFQVDSSSSTISGLYVQRAGLIPFGTIKSITGPGGDDLVCQILQARGNHGSLFGRPRPSRFDIGFDLLAKDESKLPKDKEAMRALMNKVEAVREFLWQTGKGRVVGEQEQPTFSQCMKMIIKDGLRYGQLAIEMLQDPEDTDKLYGFRAADAGQIYRTTEFSKHDDSFRISALEELKRLYGKKEVQQVINIHEYLKGEYIYTQVINGTPKQFFTADEMIVHNLYPTTDTNYNGYAITPIDQAIHQITMHINITMHNKLYFQYGRAARGMLVIQSRAIDDKKLQNMRAQFQQTINSVRHAHRMPVFTIGLEDNISWQPIDNSTRDMEFQFLYETNMRIILGAFNMSPDELPGYGHLSRGTNSQALSESNSEYKLTAARDTGIRPLLTDLEDFFNHNILPRIDKEVSSLFALSFCGLDEDDPQKEATRLQQDIQTHATMNDVMDRVEKDRLPPEVGGDMPLNPVFWQTVSPYLTVGTIMENFLGIKGAAKDPRYGYIRDNFYFQQKQLEAQNVQMKVQMAMTGMQQQAGLQDPNQQDDEGEESSGEQPEQLQRSQDGMNAISELDSLKKRWGI